MGRTRYAPEIRVHQDCLFRELAGAHLNYRRKFASPGVQYPVGMQKPRKIQDAGEAIFFFFYNCFSFPCSDFGRQIIFTTAFRLTFLHPRREISQTFTFLYILWKAQISRQRKSFWLSSLGNTKLTDFVWAPLHGITCYLQLQKYYPLCYHERYSVEKKITREEKSTKVSLTSNCWRRRSKTTRGEPTIKSPNAHSAPSYSWKTFHVQHLGSIQPVTQLVLREKNICAIEHNAQRKCARWLRSTIKEAEGFW